MGGIKQKIKSNPKLMDFTFRAARIGLNALGLLSPVKEKTMMFVSLSGRNYDDSPKALYEYIRERPEFKEWKFYWGIVDPDRVHIPGAEVVKFGTLLYWRTLLSCRVWIGNGGIDKGVNLVRKQNLAVNTWHGFPLKRIEGEENSNKVLKDYRSKRPIDHQTIRCCQSEFDREVFARVFRADKDCFIMSGLPRNDCLIRYSEEDKKKIKANLGIAEDKKVILYMPTYREYLINSDNEIYLAPPMNLTKWEEKLGSEYCLLMRAHYAVSASLGVKNNEFVMDVSKFSPLDDLYAIADILISDYSSCYFDYAILGRPMRCFAYDLERYEQERGFYLDPEKDLPCPVHRDEDELIKSIIDMDYEVDCEKTRTFAKRFIPNEGNACEAVTETILSRLAADG